MLCIDTHVDVPLNYMHELDPSTETELQVDLPKLERGQVNACVLIAFSPQGPLQPAGYAEAKKTALRRAQAIRRLCAVHAKRAEFVSSPAALRQAAASGKRAILLGMENAYPLGEDLAELQQWADLGIIYCGLTHIGHNQFADSSDLREGLDAEELHGGLSERGRDLVAALNDHGIMVDVSHSARSTMLQAVECSRAPVIASHSGAMAIAKHPRNLDDEQLRALRDCGGVAQMVALSAYVKALTAEQVAFRQQLSVETGIHNLGDYFAAEPDLQAYYMQQRNEAVYDLAPRASVSDFVDHFDHAVQVAGIDHVGIASDFDGGGGLDGWTDASQSQNVTAELKARGYDSEQIAKIWGRNFLRVMQRVQDAAKSPHA